MACGVVFLVELHTIQHTAHAPAHVHAAASGNANIKLPPGDRRRRCVPPWHVLFSMCRHAASLTSVACWYATLRLEPTSAHACWWIQLWMRRQPEGGSTVGGRSCTLGWLVRLELDSRSLSLAAAAGQP